MSRWVRTTRDVWRVFKKHNRRGWALVAEVNTRTEGLLALALVRGELRRKQSHKKRPRTILKRAIVGRKKRGLLPKKPKPLSYAVKRPVGRPRKYPRPEVQTPCADAA